MKQIPAKKSTALFFIFFLSFFAFAIDWPAREGRVTANFGISDEGIPLLGNEFAAAGPVFPADMGELIFVHDPENHAVRFPSPLGSWMALDHGDNMAGIYGRYEDRQGTPVPTLVESGTVLAAAGRTGWSQQNGFYFAVFDRRERRWVNPSVIITGNISGIEDRTPPVIRQVELRTVAGTPINPGLTQRLTQGLYTIYVDVWDSQGTGGELLAPNRITCSINGEEKAVLSYETLVSREGKRMVYRSGTVPAAQVYDPRGFGLGEIRLTRGQAILVIEARDIMDNARSVTYRLTID
ncbi:MAG: hypothetical protein FWG27_04725 [Treponema sp.]|nr:hypothetical protein [Treponema sp.]